jgi:serine/threonine-protein kinase
MGIVFEAQHLRTDRKVALKWLHEKVRTNPEARQRLVREALATGRVSHPNVVEILDVVEQDDSLFLVMELLTGETLDALIGRGLVPAERLITLLLPAMRGVAEAHRQGVIHRDIHPANIFLSRHGDEVVPKVVDFGICKVGDDDSPNLTQVGTTLGTPHYMSFEQLCNPREVDARTDVYSFAVILYRALTGRPPFEGASFTEVAIKIGSAVPVPPTALCADVPRALERVILRGMERDRERRIPDMDSLIRELEPFAQLAPSAGRSSERAVRLLASTSPAARDDEQPVRLPVQKRWPLAVLALFAVGGAGFLGWSGAGPARRSPPPLAVSAPAQAPIHQTPEEERLPTPAGQPVTAPLAQPTTTPLEQPPVAPPPKALAQGVETPEPEPARVELKRVAPVHGVRASDAAVAPLPAVPARIPRAGKIRPGEV